MFKRINEKTFDLVYPILEEAFPKEELRTREGQKSLLGNPCYRLFSITNAEEAIQGVIAAWEIDDFLYIDHLAIKPEYRNSGFGGKKLLEFVDKVGKPLVFEVEPEGEEMAERRIAFYERLGFVMNPYPYLQPPMRQGHGMTPLRIMTSGGVMPRVEFERRKKLIHKIAYQYEEV